MYKGIVDEDLSATHVLVTKQGSGPFWLHKNTWNSMKDSGDLNGHVLHVTEPPEVTVFKQLKDLQKNESSVKTENVIADEIGSGKLSEEEMTVSISDEEQPAKPAKAERVRKVKNEG